MSYLDHAGAEPLNASELAAKSHHDFDVPEDEVPATPRPTYTELQQALTEVERQRDRAEQCIEQVRKWRRYFFEDGPMSPKLRDILAAYDAARVTPAPAEPEGERG